MQTIWEYKKYIHNMCYYVVAVFVGIFCNIYDLVYASDLLYKVYDNANANDYVVRDRATAETVGSKYIWGNDSLLVNGTRRFLRMSIIISVTLIIIAGIRYVMARGDATAEKKAKQMIINILLGIVVAMSSVAIIYIILTITRNSLSI